MNWQIFSYNFHWEDYSFLFRVLLPKITASVPLAGYLVLFNDGVSQFITFGILTDQKYNFGIVTSATRLRLVYFGLVLLGVGASVYFVRRPYVIKIGDTFENYRIAMMNLASPSMFINIHGQIRNTGYDPWTRGGKYYDRDYEDFMELATGSRPGTSIREAWENGRGADWPEAVRKYEPMLTGMLRETYFREGRRRRISLRSGPINVLAWSTAL